jgi:antitoxin (DNA-binding transcriptional repressor) of toxin-antitoxin stability system
MKEVTVHEAKTHLSRLLREVEDGATILLKRGNKVVARLVPSDQPVSPRVWGQGQGRIKVCDDFDEPLPDDILSHFQ